MSVSSISLFPDDADIAKTYLLKTQTALNKTQIKWGFHCLIASSVSLFSDDAERAEIHLAVTQTALNNLRIEITRRIWLYRQNRPEGPKETVLCKKKRDRKISPYCLLQLLLFWYSAPCLFSRELLFQKIETPPGEELFYFTEYLSSLTYCMCL